MFASKGSVTGDMVTVRSGGPDDLQYVVTNKRFTGHLLRTAKITVLTMTNGIQFPPLSQAKFPRWIANDHDSRIFAVTGPFKAIRELNEQYHP